MSRLVLWLTAFIATSFLIFLSFIPTIHHFRQAPSGTVFLGTHNNSLDYPMFVSVINRAQRGLWTNKAVFTSEIQPATLVHWVYIPLGKVTKLLGLNGIQSYQLGRIIFGYTLAFSAFFYIFSTFHSSLDKRLSQTAFLLISGAFFLTLFSGGFTRTRITTQISRATEPPPFQITLPTVTPVQIQFLGPYLDWWTGGDILRRHSFQPHAMLKNTLLLAILALFARLLPVESNDGVRGKPRGLVQALVQKIKSPFIILLPLFGFMLALHDPINSLTIIAVLGVYVLGCLFKTHAINKLNRLFTTLLPYSIFSLVGLSLTFWAFNFTPWKVVADWEALQYKFIPFFEFTNHLGLTFYLGIPGLIFLCFSTLPRFRSKFPSVSPNGFLVWTSAVLVFVDVAMILTGASRLVNISLLRFFQTPLYLFLSIGTIYLLYLLSYPVKKQIRPVIFFLLLMLSLLPSLPSFPLSITSQKNQWSTQYWNTYMDFESFAIISSLKDISHPDDVVLGNPLVGEVVPTVSGNIVYIGHKISTINYPVKEKLIFKFIRNEMTYPEALQFVKSTRAKYLIVIYPEQQTINPQKYPFLIPIRDNGTVTLFQINL